MKTLNFKTLLAIFSFSIASSAHSSPDESVNNAYRYCMALDNIGILSKPCDVSGWHSSIDITVDIRTSEAIQLCNGLVAQAPKLGVAFDRGWKIRIYSPYSGENTIAQCRF